jgi:hypothetical protein
MGKPFLNLFKDNSLNYIFLIIPVHLAAIGLTPGQRSENAHETQQSKNCKSNFSADQERWIIFRSNNYPANYCSHNYH